MASAGPFPPTIMHSAKPYNLLIVFICRNLVNFIMIIAQLHVYVQYTMNISIFLQYQYHNIIKSQ